MSRMKRPGRPREGERRKQRMDITIDPEVAEFIEGLGPQFNASAYVNRALWALKSQTSDEARLNQLERDIFDLRQKLSVLESEYKTVRARVEDKERIRLEINLETDCHAWYLRSMVQSGVFQVFHREPVDPVPLVKELIAERKIRAYEIEDTPDGMRLTEKATKNTMRILRKHIGRNNRLVPSTAESWVVPFEQELMEKYFIKIDFAQFQMEFLDNKSMSDAPTEFFKQFSPLIISDSVKKEVKQKMMPFYQKPPEVSVNEYKGSADAADEEILRYTW